MKIPWLIFLLVASFIIYTRYEKSRLQIEKRFPGLFGKHFSELSDYEQEQLKIDKQNKKYFAGWTVAALALTLWAGVWQPHLQGVNRENQHKAFLAGYLEGWDFYCGELFNSSNGSISPNGLLYAGNSAFDAGWCKGLRGTFAEQNAYVAGNRDALAASSNVPAEKDAGTNAGYRESRAAVFSMVQSLCYGSECVSNDSEESRITEANAAQWETGQESNIGW